MESIRIFSPLFHTAWRFPHAFLFLSQFCSSPRPSNKKANPIQSYIDVYIGVATGQRRSRQPLGAFQAGPDRPPFRLRTRVVKRIRADFMPIHANFIQKRKNNRAPHAQNSRKSEKTRQNSAGPLASRRLWRAFVLGLFRNDFLKSVAKKNFREILEHIRTYRPTDYRHAQYICATPRVVF